MKWILILLALCSIARADDFTTTDGVKHSGSISRVEPDGIVIETDAGIEKLRFDALPKAVQERFKYDPSSAKAFISSVQASQQQLAQRKYANEQIAKDRVAALVAAATPRPTPKLTAPFESINNALTPPEERVTIVGEVIQRTHDGLLIDCEESTTSGAKKAKGLIWLKGLDAREGSRVRGAGILHGTFDYVTIQGADRMADCYEWCGGSAK